MNFNEIFAQSLRDWKQHKKKKLLGKKVSWTRTILDPDNFGSNCLAKKFVEAENWQNIAQKAYVMIKAMAGGLRLKIAENQQNLSLI